MSVGLNRTSSVLNLLQFKSDFVPADVGLKNTCHAATVPLTKIVATLGPATSTPETIRQILSEGVDVVRMNFSHGDYQFHTKIYQTVRKVAAELHKEVAVIADLQGPKVRTNTFPGGHITITKGQIISVIASDEPGKDGLITTKFTQMVTHCQVGEHILIDDGLMKLVVLERKPNELVCQVEQGGIVKDHKGMNLPETDLGPMPALTDKDKADAAFVLSHLDVDFFALSFVRRAQDVLDLRSIINQQKKPVRIIVKIEKPEAVHSLDDILAVSDACMVARGDLAVEVGPAKVPCIQKHIIRHCIEMGVPVITATQMLESMTHNPTPTRAEATDVANAIFDGTDCVMLSGETAAGEFPTETVRMMRQIIRETEFHLREGKKSQFHPHEFDPTRQRDSSGSTFGFAVGQAAHVLAQSTDAVCFGCVSDTGNAAIRLSTSRPAIPIYVFSSLLSTVRRVCLTRGAIGMLLPTVPPAEDIFAVLESRLKESGSVNIGETVVYTAGLPTLGRATTNTVHVKTVQ